MPNESFGRELPTLTPRWRHPADPASIEAAMRLFAGEDSQWNLETMGRTPQSWTTFQRLIASPLLRSVVFRDRLPE